jgi:hypothetical protein
MFEKLGEVAVPIGSLGLGIDNAPGLEVIGKMWISMAELARYVTSPNVRHEKTVDMPLKGGGGVKAHLFSVDGMLVEGMGAICIMGDHTALKAESMAQQGLEESIQDYRDYQDAADTESSLTVIENGRETTHVIQ